MFFFLIFYQNIDLNPLFVLFQFGLYFEKFDAIKSLWLVMQ